MLIIIVTNYGTCLIPRMVSAPWWWQSSQEAK